MLKYQWRKESKLSLMTKRTRLQEDKVSPQNFQSISTKIPISDPTGFLGTLGFWKEQQPVKQG